MQKLQAKAAIQIASTPGEVYEAIIDPARMSNYFIERGSARMEEGKTVTWKFPEFDDQVPVRIVKLEPGKFVSFHWDFGEQEHLVEIRLEPVGSGTVVRVTEENVSVFPGRAISTEVPAQEASSSEAISALGQILEDRVTAELAWLIGNTEGWANFLACFKASLEYGINLRNGAFEFMRNG